MNITEKSAYLKGLMDGLNLDTEKAEGKLIASIVDLLGDVTRKLTDVESTTIAISDELDEIEEDLDAIEDFIMDDEDEDYDDYEDDFDDFDDEDDFEDEGFDYGSVYYNQTKDVHPPLYYLIAYVFVSIFGTGLKVYKVVSIVPMVLTMLLGLFYIKPKFGEKAAILYILFDILIYN